jgi:hypothetical protein
MGRSFEVRRKSENLPVIGYTLVVFSRTGTQMDFRYLWHKSWNADCNRNLVPSEVEGSKIINLKSKTAVSLVRTAVFLLSCPREKGRKPKENAKAILRMGGVKC